jgi:hypothetical protein
MNAARERLNFVMTEEIFIVPFRGCGKAAPRLESLEAKLYPSK